MSRGGGVSGETREQVCRRTARILRVIIHILHGCRSKVQLVSGDMTT